jgi:hypothetical protein
VPWVADYTSRIAPAALKAAGVVGVCRYLSRSSWKVIGQAEYNELTRAGLGVVLNFEDEATGWLGGGSAGAADAVFAADAARALGYPSGSVIPSSADFDMSAGQWNSAGRAYAVAYRDRLRQLGYEPGVYGAWDLLGWCQAVGYRWFWQAGLSTAWSNGRNAKPWPGAYLWQRYSTTVAGTEVDHNDIRRVNWQGGTVSAEADDKIINWIDPRVAAMARLLDTIPSGPSQGEKVAFTSAIRAIQAQTAANSAGIADLAATLATVIETLADLSAKIDALAAPPLIGDLQVTGTLHVAES